MAIKIIDKTQYELYDLMLATTKADIADVEQLLLDLKHEAKRLADERRKYYIEVLGGEPTYSHSLELIDKFISDHEFAGRWPDKYRCERYFFYDEKSNNWDCYAGGLNVVYYREVELRYNELKLEGKL
jgi:hypothetical protein